LGPVRGLRGDLQFPLSGIVHLVADFKLERTEEWLRFEAARQSRRSAQRNDDRGTVRLDASAAASGLVADESSPTAIAREKVRVQGVSSVNHAEIVVRVYLQARRIGVVAGIHCNRA